MTKKSLSFRKDTIFSLFRSAKDPKIERMIHGDNIRSLSIATMIVAVSELVYCLLSALLSLGGASSLDQMVSILICAFSCILVSILSRLIWLRYQKTGKLHNALTAVYVGALYLFMSIMSAAVDLGRYRDGEQMLFFYIVQFCFLLFLSLRPIPFLAMSTVTFTWFCINIIAIDGAKGFNFTNLAVLYTLSVCGNAIKYSTRVARHEDRLKLKLQMEENEIVIAQSGKYATRYDLKRNVVYNDANAVAALGIPPQITDPKTAIPVMAFVLPESRAAVESFYADMERGIPVGSGDFHIRRLDGTVIWQHGDYTLQKDESGEYVRSIISFSEVTRQMEQKLIHEQRIAEIVSIARNCDFYAEGSIERFVIDKFNVVKGTAKGIPAIEGHSVSTVLDTDLKHLIHPDDYAMVKEFFSQDRLKLLMAGGVTTDRIEFRLSSETVDWYCIDLCLIRSEDTSETNFFAMFRDINDARKQYAKLVNQATQDELTQLYNREATMQRIREYLDGEGAEGTHALIMIDLDNFKKVNDTLGHQVGDDALCKIGHTLTNTFHQSDICGRVGGDEFFAFVKNIGVETVVRKAKRLLTELQQAYSSNGRQIVISASMGITMYHGEIQPKKTLRTLYAEADAALYKAKALGKNTYTFADEIDAIAATSASSDAISKNETMSYNLRGLLDNLASGIAIFHGSKDGFLRPVFCNDRLLTLLRLSEEQFFTHMSYENGYAIHPDDVERTNKNFNDTFASDTPIQDTFRLIDADGEVHHMTSFANIRPLDNGEFDLYVIYSQAKEAEQLRLMRENRYSQFTVNRTGAIESSVAYLFMNISKNTCGDNYIKSVPLYAIDCSGTVENYLSDVAKNIASANIREEFLRRFAIDTYDKEITDGCFIKELRIPLLLKGNSIHWYHFFTEATKSPVSGEIEAFATLSDIDNEVRLGLVIDRMLENEYEFLAQIDAQNGYITRLGNIGENLTETDADGDAEYSRFCKKNIETILPPEYREEGAEAMSLERILRELESQKVYSCTFPTALHDGKKERICQWNFEYVDDLQTTILMTRTNISKFLDYGYDSLTGMLGRRGFCQRVRSELNDDPTRAYRLIVIDFDNFKLINEEYGYIGGNRFLRQFAADVRQRTKRFGRGSLAARLEADYFIFFLPSDSGPSPEDVYDEISGLIGAYPEAYRLTLRMGVYEITDPSLDVDLMCDCANLAHKSCKGKFTEHIKYYTHDLRDKMLDEQLLSSEMQNAIEEEQFDVWFQPQINHAAGGSLIGGEALVRWNHPTRGLLSPGAFIPLFEQSGSIYELDKYVWRRACSYVRRTLDEGKEPLPISVNISRMDILQADFMDTLIAITEESNIPYDLLHLEITESIFTDNAGSMVEIIKELIRRGFTVVIDDFGSGYSSLSLLKSIPAHILKLDMRFFQDQEDTLRNECIIESIVRMAKMLGMAVLAEGVTNVGQADFLRSVGCNYVQGFLYSKPLCYEDYVEYSKNKTMEQARLAAKRTKESWETEKASARELFRNIISDSNEIIMVADIQTKQLLYANRAAERYYGKGFDPLEETTCSTYCAHSDRCINCPAISLKRGEKKELLFSENGTHMKTLYTRMEWNGHEAFVISQTDISAEMQDVELADSLIRNIPGAMLVFSFDENKTPILGYISEQAANVFASAGLEGEKLTLKKCLTIVHPDDVLRVKLASARSFLRKTCFREEFRLILKSGSVLWIELIANPIADKNGNYQFYGIYTDITDRKNAQARVDTLIHNLPSALTIYEIRKDEINRIFISDKAKEILNTSDDTHQKVSMDILYRHIHPEDEQRIREITDKCIARRDPFCVQFRLKGEDASYRWVQLESTPIVTGDDECLYYSNYTDISAQKQLELGVVEENTFLNTQDAVNIGLQEAMRQKTPDASIDYILAFMGKALHGERAYIFESNGDGTVSNTYEWVADGVTAEIENLQNIPDDICRPWYEQFESDGAITISDTEDIRLSHPKIYDMLTAQAIRTLVAAPFFNDHGGVMGFLGLDNLPTKSITSRSVLIQTIAFFIEAALKRRNLIRLHEKENGKG